MEQSDNVLQFPSLKAKLSREDRETIEAILHLLTRSEIPYAACEVTQRSMNAIRRGMPGEIQFRGFRFPVSFWDGIGVENCRLIVIDAGKGRAFYYSDEAFNPSKLSAERLKILSRELQAGSGQGGAGDDDS